MDPATWRTMVDRTRELERSLGCGIKKVEGNEQQTAVLQRRSIRVAHDLAVGAVIQRNDLVVLRPAPIDSLAPYELPKLVGLQLRRSKRKGDCLLWNDFE